MCQIARFLPFLATLFPILINSFINSFADSLRFLRSLTARRTVLAAENLFLRKQLAFYQEHQIRPRRLTATARFSLLFWSRFCDWRNALVIVKPETLIGWHRKGYKLFWKWKSRPGPATHSCPPSSADRRDGSGESDLGTSTHRR
jgi:hypothetical protein